MRRRLCLVVTAIAAAPLAVGVAVATAAAGGTVKTKPAVTKLRCHSSVTVVPPSDSATVDQPPSQGDSYGPLHCPTALFGSGIVHMSFTVPDSGDIVGKYTQYFGDGTVHGTFDLAPQESAGNFTPANFTSQTWEGTLKVKGGTAAFKLIKELKGKKGLGTLTCTSPDTVHLSCTEKVKLSAV